MEVFGKSVPTNVIFLSTILGQDGPNPVHKCDWKCENEHVCGNMYHCKLTGLTHICDQNCNQRILYDNHSSLCRVSRKVSPLTAVEIQAVKGIRRKLDADTSPSESCAFKRRRDAQFHPSPFQRTFSAINPICSQAGEFVNFNAGLPSCLIKANHCAVRNTLNTFSPGEVQLVEGGGIGVGGVVIACKSVCEAYGLDQYCCSGQFVNPTTSQLSF